MNNQYNGHLCIVFALEHYNPLNMIRALGENGINQIGRASCRERV